MMTTSSEFCKIPLTQGQVAIVDASDYEWLSQWKWYAWWDRRAQGFIAVRNSPTVEGKRTIIRMHRLLSGLDPDDLRQPDHINRNTLDNRRSNIRIANRAQNCANRTNRTNKSGYKGVSWRKKRSAWTVQLMVNRKSVFYKELKSLPDAAQIYALMAYLHNGEFSRIAMN